LSNCIFGSSAVLFHFNPVLRSIPLTRIHAGVLLLPMLCAAAFVSVHVEAQAPPPEFKAVPIEAPAAASIPLAASGADNEQWERILDQDMVRNVTRPALYPVLPGEAQRNGKAVVVVPGGGYRFVSMDSEGMRVARRLAEAGYSAFILKYRTMYTPPNPDEYMVEMAALFGSLGKSELADHQPAVDDLATAIRYVREHAANWQVDPAHVGAIGFSAGSRTLIRLIEGYPEAGLLRHVGLVYPPMTQTITGGPRPPLFMAIAVDDPLFRQGGLNMLEQWLQESDKTEFHLYSGGSHGFGMRKVGATSDHWIDQYLAWLSYQ
jgi:acetyl esterase/lipase